jgi:hypothetical protein
MAEILLIFGSVLLVFTVAVGAVVFFFEVVKTARDLPGHLAWIRQHWNAHRPLAILLFLVVLLASGGFILKSSADLRKENASPQTSEAATAGQTRAGTSDEIGPIPPPGPCPADPVNASLLYGGDKSLWRRTSSDVWQFGTEDNETPVHRLSIPIGDEGEWKLQSGRRDRRPGPHVVEEPVVFARIRC